MDLIDSLYSTVSMSELCMGPGAVSKWVSK